MTPFEITTSAEAAGSGSCSMRAGELDVGEAALDGEAPGLRELRIGHVAPDYAVALAGLARGQGGCPSRSGCPDR